MTERLDDLLSQAGRRYRTAPPARGPRPDDAIRRGQARRRNQRAVAGGVLVAVLLSGVAALARPFDGASQHLDYGGSTVPAPTATEPSTTFTGTVPPTASTEPTTTVPTTTTTARTVPPPQPGATGVRQINWLTKVYPADSCPNWPADTRDITVVPAGSPGGFESRVAELVDVQFGQLIEDAPEEALVTLTCDGTQGPTYGWVWQSSIANDIRRIGVLTTPAAVSRELRDRYGIAYFSFRSFALGDGHIIAEGKGHRPTDPNCCPGYPRIVLDLQVDRNGETTGTVVSVEPLPGQLGGPGE
jgi:hypothetical protein